jgi:hypothetical protein
MSGGHIQSTYVHLLRKAASIIAPEVPSFFWLRSAEVIEASMIAG